MKFLNKLIRMAGRSEHRHRHATILIRGGRLLSSGYNHNGKHAEEHAITKFKGRHFSDNAFKNVTAINIRLGWDGKFKKCAPCENCIELLRKNKIYEVYYINDNGNWESRVIF